MSKRYPLEQAEKFVPSKSTIPIFSEILLEASNEGLSITGEALIDIDYLPLE
ncbi:hypothetical protein [Paenibacillus macquariensis]|uniref:hypothetical protein n=1 Tax=Paenibacillus macquariensis TaxID=948756 RepID=UPI00373FDE1E